ncbi:hypothetical protein Tco_1044908 [Tanacetum coccineum]|uniref:Uncharacterized protein n=1 Tax=Tanacetum coccineum TaxID=301880 RepID=A0ABQ5GRR1_9ASTR
MMRESEVPKISDDTLTRILEKLDHMVKDFMLFKFNPGMENRIWSEDDKRRSKEFIEVIERRLKIRRIFRNMKSFVSGSVSLDALVLRTASAAAKPCQGDSSEFYLITGSILDGSSCGQVLKLKNFKNKEYSSFQDPERIMNPLIVQQRALDDALVAPDDRAEIGKCNMRIVPTKTQKEATYQVVPDTLKLSP